MYEIIKSIIIKWDPIRLLAFSPKDEYDNECLSIYKEYLQGCKPLGEIIFDIFNYSFGSQFRKNLSQCNKIASKIEKKIKYLPKE